MPRPTLILTPRFTPDSQALWRAGLEQRWDVERLASYRVPPELRQVPEPVLYLESLFGPAIANEFGLTLLDPPEDWLARLPAEYRKRKVEFMTLGEARKRQEPAFVKPSNDKSFPARIYRPEELPGCEDHSPVYVSEIVRWEREYRTFVLDRQIRTISIYLRDGTLQRDNDYETSPIEVGEVQTFLNPILADPLVNLPRALVLDVGVIEGRGWGVVEANSAWGSGLYGCHPNEVLTVLRHASVALR